MIILASLDIFLNWFCPHFTTSEVIFFNVTSSGRVFSVAKGPPKTPSNYSKTSESKLSNHLLFISIRQIFDHIHVFEKQSFSDDNFRNFRNFMKIRKIPRIQNCAETVGFWALTETPILNTCFQLCLTNMC